MIYDTTSERYSHLAGLTEDEITMVMFISDTICDIIRNGREKQLDPRQIFQKTEKENEECLKCFCCAGRSGWRA